MIVRVPGDKSVSQRALILAALAEGESRLTGLLASADPSSTARALCALGAEIDALPADGGPVAVIGRGLRGLGAPSGPLDLGNSGTGARLLLGVLAGCPFDAMVTGDESLRSRPMRRVTDPLSSMGATFDWLEAEGRLPVRVRGGALRPLDYDLPVASAQIKSALLLAGLVAGVRVSLTEPGRSRDHTERMFRHVGVVVRTGAERGRWSVQLPEPPERLAPLDFHVPGDFSSAAFLLAAGLLGLGGGEVTVADIGLNPTRTGFLPLLERMGAHVEVEGGQDDGEPVGRITVRPAALGGVEVGAADVVAAIDEIPVLVALAARARGTTRITGASELRVKETDRIRALVDGLRAVGVAAEELDDGLVVEGTDAPLAGTVDSKLDHRIAMAFGVLGALPGNDIRVVGEGSVDVSFPGFWDALASMAGAAGRGSGAAPDRRTGADGERRAASPGRARGPIVTLDGPAGSGKSTTAREVARQLGFRHLDSGALYRALTYALLRDGVPREAWPRLREEDLGRYEIRMVPAEGGRFDVALGGRPLEDAALRTPEVTEHVASVASLPAVRAWLLERQREAGEGGDLVADGRDMGTVVFPDADLKVFLVAELGERARRRLRDHGAPEPSEKEVGAEARRLEARDRTDSEREIAPLARPRDGWELDTTGLDFEAQVQAIVDELRRRLGTTG